MIYSPSGFATSRNRSWEGCFGARTGRASRDLGGRTPACSSGSVSLRVHRVTGLAPRRLHAQRLSNVLTIDGRVRGAWRRVSVGGAVRVELRVLEHLTPPEVAAAEKAGGLMSRFLERPLELAWQR